MLGFHPIRFAQHLEAKGMHPIHAMAHSIATYVALHGPGDLTHTHVPPTGPANMNENHGLLPFIQRHL